MKALLIAEKPSLMRKIRDVVNQKGFKDEITFVAQAGHLLTLKTPAEIDHKYKKWELQTVPVVYPYEYKISDGKEKLLKDIKTELQKDSYDYIINAGDPDQEGELLIRENLVYLNNKLPVKRFWVNDLTPTSIINALNNMKDDSEYDSIYEAALTRQHLDYQFGMNVTQSITLKMGDLCKLGRVKAPIVYLIATRENEIKNFVKETWYQSAFLHKDVKFINETKYKNKAEVPVVESEFAKVNEVKSNVKTVPLAKLFKLSTLQTESYRQLKWSGKKTLEVLQRLYDAQAVSYPRTDCEYISSNENLENIFNTVINEVNVSPDLITRTAADVKKDTRFCNDTAIAKEGHTAIIPTGNGFKGTDADEEALYEIIARRFIVAFSRPKFVKTTQITATPDGKTFYVAKHVEDVDVGYVYIINPDYRPKPTLPFICEKGDILSPIEFIIHEAENKPPQRYNDGSIIKALDNPKGYKDANGNIIKYEIGTQATRASIIDECQKNGYFDKKNGAYYATEKALTLIKEFGHIPLFNPVTSGVWESRLKAIREGNESGLTVEKNLINEMISTVTKIKESEITASINKTAKEIGTCPNCGAPFIDGRYGAYCSKKCGFTINQAFGHKFTLAEQKKLLEGKSLKLTGLKSKVGKTYSATITPVAIERTESKGKVYYGYKFNMAFK